MMCSWGIPSLKLTWPLKMDGWKMNFLLGRPIFRGYVMIMQHCTWGNARWRNKIEHFSWPTTRYLPLHWSSPWAAGPSNSNDLTSDIGCHTTKKASHPQKKWVCFQGSSSIVKHDHPPRQWSDGSAVLQCGGFTWGRCCWLDCPRNKKVSQSMFKAQNFFRIVPSLENLNFSHERSRVCPERC